MEKNISLPLLICTLQTQNVRSLLRVATIFMFAIELSLKCITWKIKPNPVGGDIFLFLLRFDIFGT